MKQFVIGLDIGTTSTKAVIFNRNGMVISEHEVEYPLIKKEATWAEQDPDEIEFAAKKAIHSAIEKNDVNKQDLIAIGISSAMHSLICLGKDGKPLSYSITWADGRSAEQASQLKNQQKGLDIYLKTGTPIHPMSPLLKLIWMNNTGYPAYNKAYKFISIKEYLISKWFGKYLVDYSVAAATGLFNIKTNQWDDEALSLAGISEDQLSEVVPPTYQIDGLSQEVADDMGVSSDLPFIIGASDGPLANLGIGAINKGEVAVTIGTSGAIRQISSTPKTDEKQEIFCYSFTDDLWVMGGPTNNGGIVLRWLQDVLGETELEKAKSNGESPYDLLTSAARKVTAGSNGLLFMPHLNGERAPFWDAQAQGSYIGLTSSHEKRHLIRAGLEGVIFAIFHVGEALNRLAGQPSQIYASGGFARSDLWLQILADIFGTEVRVPESHQSSAWGAAWLALMTCGEVSSLDGIKESIPMKTSVIPDKTSHQTYQELYLVYRELYQSLKPHLHSLSKFK